MQRCAAAIFLAGLFAILPGNGTAEGRIPAHVITGDYLAGYSGTRKVSAREAAPYLTWAEVDANESNGIEPAGLTTLNYADPGRLSVGEPLWTADERVFAHDCRGQRVSGDYDVGAGKSIRQYLTDPHSPQLRSLVQNHVKTYSVGTRIDAYFFDDIGTVYGMANRPCGYDESWNDAWAGVMASVSRPVVFNGLRQATLHLVSVPNVIGAMTEDCYDTKSQPTPPYTSGAEWVSHANLQLEMARAHKLFFCLNNATLQAAGAAKVRTYVYASFMLSFDLSTSALWEMFATPSGLHVLPESQLVPLHPVRASPADISELRDVDGNYERKYAHCWLARRDLGPCIAVVNPDPAHVHRVSHHGYRRTLRLSGAGVMDGGVAGPDGPAPPSTLEPMTAFIGFD